MSTFFGSSGNDSFSGGGASDDFLMADGGDDTVSGSGGSDTFSFEGAFTAADRVDGGLGYDTLILYGDYSVPVVLDAGSLKDVEHISFSNSGPFHDYAITFAAGTVAAGAGMAIDGVGIDITLDNSASLASSTMDVTMAPRALTFIGGAAGEHINLTGPGDGQFSIGLGGGDDTVVMASAFASNYQFAGGDGYDTASISTNNSTLARLNLTAAKFSGFEAIRLDGLAGYDLKVANDVIGAGQTLAVTIGFGSTHASSVDAGKVTDGSVDVTGASHDDTLIGGRGADSLDGGGGANVLIGRGGADLIDCSSGDGDSIVYKATGDSTKRAPDLVSIGNAWIDLSAIDADRTVDGNQAFSLVAAFDHHAGQMTVAYKARTDLTNISLDVDGDGKADSVITLSGDHHDFTNFVL